MQNDYSSTLCTSCKKITDAAKQMKDAEHSNRVCGSTWCLMCGSTFFFVYGSTLHLVCCSTLRLTKSLLRIDTFALTLILCESTNSIISVNRLYLHKEPSSTLLLLYSKKTCHPFLLVTRIKRRISKSMYTKLPLILWESFTFSCFDHLQYIP